MLHLIAASGAASIAAAKLFLIKKTRTGAPNIPLKETSKSRSSTHTSQKPWDRLGPPATSEEEATPTPDRTATQPQEAQTTPAPAETLKRLPPCLTGARQGYPQQSSQSNFMTSDGAMSCTRKKAASASNGASKNNPEHNHTSDGTGTAATTHTEQNREPGKKTNVFNTIRHLV